MQLKKLLFTILLLLCSCDQLEKKSTEHAPENFIVATNAEFPPYTYIENDKLVGFDIDIATEVAKRLGKGIVFKEMPFDLLISSVASGSVDFAAAGISYTAKRAKSIAFTKPYLTDDPLVILTLKHSDAQKHLEMKDLDGQTVVVNRGYTADLFLSTPKHRGIHIVRLATPADGFIALKNGRANAFVTAESTVNAYLGEDEALKFHSDIITETAETCALVLSKENTMLLGQIQVTLDAIEKDGTISRLKAQWHLK
jgi:polar amino acid transport system substrate-binding protein